MELCGVLKAQENEDADKGKKNVAEAEEAQLEGEEEDEVGAEADEKETKTQEVETEAAEEPRADSHAVTATEKSEMVQ